MIKPGPQFNRANTRIGGAQKDSPGDSTASIGIVEWFRIGERDRVDAVLADMRALGIEKLRFGVSWADWHSDAGQRWQKWLIPHLADHAELLPCFVHTPPSIGLAPRISSPPRNLKAYADYIDEMISAFGRYFEWVELWTEPDRLGMWDTRLDHDWMAFSKMIGAAAHWAKKRGKQTVLGATTVFDAIWLELMADREVLKYIDVVGVHRALKSADNNNLPTLPESLALHRVWVTQADYSTWAYDEPGQLGAFLHAIREPVERVYWASMYDLQPEQITIDGFHCDESAYHMGLKHADGRPKLLFRLWSSAASTNAVRDVANLTRRNAHHSPGSNRFRRQSHIVITGGAGFIGTNLADRLLRGGQHVMIYDNLSRDGVERNLQWLRDEHDERLMIEIADVRDRFALRRALRNADMVFHFAAQVAVTTSLQYPLHDFEVNANGTLTLLEELRLLAARDGFAPPLLFTSTNKVYGALPDVDLTCNDTRYEPESAAVREFGVSEMRPLDFHSPYGCSKGVADQAAHDFARSFGLRTIVFRMSCIYGPHQFGTEDQGWVAHFARQALAGQPICLYGDGRQVRDLLYVDDLIDAMTLAQARIDTLSGRAFNIGGGPSNAASLLELIHTLEQVLGRPIELRRDDWRTGDQRYYVSDTRQFSHLTGWTPRVGVREGVARLLQWLDSQSSPTADFRQPVATRSDRTAPSVVANSPEPTAP